MLQVSIRGYKYCDLMRDNASQMIYCNFTKNRTADEIIRSLTDTLFQAGTFMIHPSRTS